MIIWSSSFFLGQAVAGSQEQDLSNVVFKHYAMQTFYVGTFPCKIVNDYLKKNIVFCRKLYCDVC